MVLAAKQDPHQEVPCHRSGNVNTHSGLGRHCSVNPGQLLFTLRYAPENLVVGRPSGKRRRLVPFVVTVKSGRHPVVARQLEPAAPDPPTGHFRPKVAQSRPRPERVLELAPRLLAPNRHNAFVTRGPPLPPRLTVGLEVLVRPCVNWRPRSWFGLTHAFDHTPVSRRPSFAKAATSPSVPGPRGHGPNLCNKLDEGFVYVRSTW